MFPLFMFFMMAINEFYQRILWVAVVLFECCIIHSVLSMTQIVTPDITRSIPIKVPVLMLPSPNIFPARVVMIIVSEFVIGTAIDKSTDASVK